MMPTCAIDDCPNTCNDGDYCHGCRNYICPEHSVNATLGFGHALEDHLRDPDTEGGDDGF